jgi:hypothetical protein
MTDESMSLSRLAHWKDHEMMNVHMNRATPKSLKSLQDLQDSRAPRVVSTVKRKESEGALNSPITGQRSYWSPELAVTMCLKEQVFDNTRQVSKMQREEPCNSGVSFVGGSRIDIFTASS